MNFRIKDDDLLIVAGASRFTVYFQTRITETYAVRILGKSRDLLGCTVTHKPDVSIALSQPILVLNKVENAAMSAVNGHCTPYNNTEELHKPVE